MCIRDSASLFHGDFSFLSANDVELLYRAFRKKGSTKSSRRPTQPTFIPSPKNRVGDDAYIVPAESSVLIENSGEFDGTQWVDVGIDPLGVSENSQRTRTAGLLAVRRVIFP